MTHGPIRPPMRGTLDPLVLVAGRSMSRYRTARVRGEGTTVQRFSDHMRGAVFAVAGMLTLLAALVFAGGGSSI